MSSFIISRSVIHVKSKSVRNVVFDGTSPKPRPTERGVMCLNSPRRSLWSESSWTPMSNASRTSASLNVTVTRNRPVPMGMN